MVKNKFVLFFLALSICQLAQAEMGACLLEITLGRGEKKQLCHDLSRQGCESLIRSIKLQNDNVSYHIIYDWLPGINCAQAKIKL